MSCERRSWFRKRDLCRFVRNWELSRSLNGFPVTSVWIKAILSVENPTCGMSKLLSDRNYFDKKKFQFESRKIIFFINHVDHRFDRGKVFTNNFSCQFIFYLAKLLFCSSSKCLSIGASIYSQTEIEKVPDVVKWDYSDKKWDALVGISEKSLINQAISSRNHAFHSFDKCLLYKTERSFKSSSREPLRKFLI